VEGTELGVRRAGCADYHKVVTENGRLMDPGSMRNKRKVATLSNSFPEITGEYRGTQARNVETDIEFLSFRRALIDQVIDAYLA
jgi:hypothetical protein